jgi:putative protein kinase ArgK-like GTPase of G3E family
LNRRELSKRITQIENRDITALKEVSKLFNPDSLRKTICFTGPAGVGKSTLVAQLALEASLTQKIAWLACDPSSPETGGSLLGDAYVSHKILRTIDFLSEVYPREALLLFLGQSEISKFI